MAEYVKRWDVSNACYDIFEEVVREGKAMTAEEVRQTMLRFEKAIRQTATADVVPRADIAMEIFEELHKEIFAALESNYKAKAERMARPNVDMADEFISYCEGKIAALRGIDDLITELKNNYIKE